MSAGTTVYSQAVRDLFGEPRHGGRLASGQTARAEGQGVIVELSMESSGAAITGLRFRAYGCPHVIAAAEAMCRRYEGRSVAELAGFSAVELINELPVPIEKTGRILVLEDAVRRLASGAGTVASATTD